MAAARPKSASRQPPSHPDAAAGVTAQDEQKRSFLRAVSHELRTPLNSILGFSEILASELYGPLGADQYREYAEIIRGSGEKLLKLVNQLVEIARLQTGDIEIDLRPERLAPIFKTLADGAEEGLAARQLRLIVQPCIDVEAQVDARILRTVLANLLQNAIAFSPEGGSVVIGAERSGDRVEIVMRNEGEGVDSAELSRLVRPFEQGANALTGHGQGAGLGLAVCDAACRAMGGELRLVSERGQGFAAHVVLPVV
jgi:signal transduction histidine kinase